MKHTVVAAALVVACGLAHSQTLGRGGTVAGGQGGSDQLETCDAPKGTLAVVEPQSHMLSSLSRYGLGSPVGVLRMMVQQSNCFQVVERGVGMRNMQQERDLARSGELQSDANIGKGQMAAADFILTPALVFSDNNAGGVGGALGGLGGLLGGNAGRVIGGVAGSLKFKQAETSLLLADSRSGIQVASATGSAQQTDFAIGGALLGPLSAAGGGYTSTAEGKVIVGALLDNWNNIVRNVRNNSSLVAGRPSVASQRNAAESVKANMGAPGDVMVAKIAGVKVLRQPRDGASELQTLTRSDEVLLVGEEQNGFQKVTTARGDGWVKAILLRKP